MDISIDPLSAATSALSLATNWAGAEQANSSAKAAAQAAYERNVHSYQHRYRYMMKDMELAGLNPILAAGGSPNAGTIPGSSAASVYSPAGVDVANSALSMSQAKKAEADTEKSKAETDLIRKKALESVQKVINMRSENNLIQQNEQVAIAQMFKLEQEFAKISYEMKNLASRTALSDQEIKNLRMQEKVITATYRKLVAETAKLKAIANVYNGPLGSVLAYVQESMKALGIPLGAILLKKGR